MSIHGLSDSEVIELILENFDEDNVINREYIEVDCQGGRPILTGRVASDEELQAIEEILNDVLEIEDCDNNVWVDDTLAFEDGNEDAEETPAPLDDEEDDELEADEEEFEPEDEEL